MGLYYLVGLKGAKIVQNLGKKNKMYAFAYIKFC